MMGQSSRMIVFFDVAMVVVFVILAILLIAIYWQVFRMWRDGR